MVKMNWIISILCFLGLFVEVFSCLPTQQTFLTAEAAPIPGKSCTSDLSCPDSPEKMYCRRDFNICAVCVDCMTHNMIPKANNECAQKFSECGECKFGYQKTDDKELCILIKPDSGEEHLGPVEADSSIISERALGILYGILIVIIILSLSVLIGFLICKKCIVVPVPKSWFGGRTRCPSGESAGQSAESMCGTGTFPCCSSDTTEPLISPSAPHPTPPPTRWDFSQNPESFCKILTETPQAYYYTDERHVTALPFHRGNGAGVWIQDGVGAAQEHFQQQIPQHNPDVHPVYNEDDVDVEEPADEVMQVMPVLDDDDLALVPPGANNGDIDEIGLDEAVGLMDNTYMDLSHAMNMANSSQASSRSELSRLNDSGNASSAPPSRSPSLGLGNYNAQAPLPPNQVTSLVPQYDDTIMYDDEEGFEDATLEMEG